MGCLRLGIWGFLIAFSASGFADTTVSLTDATGRIVEVPLLEVTRVYMETFAPLGENHRIINGDGSISIVDPVFNYAGKSIPFAAGVSEHGVCKYFGFLSDHGYEQVVRKGNLVIAEMAENGTLRRIYHDQGNYSNSLIQVIVCSNRSSE